MRRKIRDKSIRDFSVIGFIFFFFLQKMISFNLVIYEGLIMTIIDSVCAVLIVHAICCFLNFLKKEEKIVKQFKPEKCAKMHFRGGKTFR